MSSTSSHVQKLLAANATFTKSYQAPFVMKQLREASSDPVLLLTCMDPRVVPEDFVGPKPLIAVFRNAGGRATPDVVRTITVLRSLSYKATQASVMVVHHTDCGMTHLTNDGIKEDVRNRNPEDAATAEKIDFGCFAEEDLEKTILEDVETLKAESLLQGVDIRGYVLSTETGQLQEL